MKKQLSYRGNEGYFSVNANKMIPILTAILFIFLLGISLFRLFYKAKTYSDVMISEHVVALVEIFKKIDKDCKIIDFDYQKNHINFLNNIKFETSEVGPMNLAYPQNWKGAYLRDHPTIQGKEYQIVRTKKGYFITPGEGVRLGNGKVIGKDIILDENADIPAMMRDKGDLNFKGKALAAPLPVGIKGVGKVIIENIVRPEDGLVMDHCNAGVHVALSDI